MTALDYESRIAVVRQDLGHAIRAEHASRKVGDALDVAALKSYLAWLTVKAKAAPHAAVVNGAAVARGLVKSLADGWAPEDARL